MSAERVQKILAQAGIASRRKAEELIREGLVTINGRVAQLGDKAEWGKDAIKVNGKLLRNAESPVYIAFYKPKGVISAMVDPDGRATLKEFLTKVHSRVFPVGRLDFNSEGLMLLTNDGEMAQKIQKSDGIPRVYQVKVRGLVQDEMLSRIQKGAWVEKHAFVPPGTTQALEDQSFPRRPSTPPVKKKLVPHLAWIESRLQNKTQIQVVIMGGQAFDIKLLFETVGFLVEKITRVGIGHITLHGLTPGKYRLLKASQVEALIHQPELGMRMLPTENPASPPDARLEDPRAERISVSRGGHGGRSTRISRGPIARDSGAPRSQKENRDRFRDTKDRGGESRGRREFDSFDSRETKGYRGDKGGNDSFSEDRPRVSTGPKKVIRPVTSRRNSSGR